MFCTGSIFHRFMQILDSSIYGKSVIQLWVDCRGSYRGEGGGGGGGVGSLARFTDEKNSESRITDIEISFFRITKISTLLSCSYATNSV